VLVSSVTVLPYDVVTPYSTTDVPLDEVVQEITIEPELIVIATSVISGELVVNVVSAL